MWPLIASDLGATSHDPNDQDWKSAHALKRAIGHQSMGRGKTL
jgi:hypothetical protein